MASGKSPSVTSLRSMVVAEITGSLCNTGLGRFYGIIPQLTLPYRWSKHGAGVEGGREVHIAFAADIQSGPRGRAAPLRVRPSLSN